MRAIPKDVRRAVEPDLYSAGDLVADTQKTLAPVDTSDLELSIHVTGPGEMTPAYSQPGGSRQAKENEVLVTVGNTDVRYPHLVEYGTRHSPAQPFFWPGFRLTRKAASGKIKRAISKAVRQNWGKS